MGRCWSAISDVFTGVPADPTPQPAPPPSGDDDFLNRLSSQLLQYPGRLIAACVVSVLGPAVVAQAGSLPEQPAPEPPAADHVAEEPVPPPIPGDALSWFPVARSAAATCPGLPSAVLVAIGHVESSLGLQPWTSSAGAKGPMQFLPSTWAAYGVDGDGDGTTDIMNPVDAVHGAARLLCVNGAADPEQLPSALWNYNRSEEYVRHVMALARSIPVRS